jgi:ribulose-5-phosphate 4-epimerase/fuculose-1-phosphate aldolase
MQQIDEGYIKFTCIHKEEKKLPIEVPEELKKVRDEMFKLGLIGHYKDLNVGYGNISIKTPKGILISATQTGEIPEISENDFALVTNYDIDKNTVWCVGKKRASSETMTHAALYEADSSINAIIHVHNKTLWQKNLNNLPTTDKNIPYGTPEMAYEMKRLYRQSADVKKVKTIIMAGHEEGIICFGQSLKDASEAIYNLLNEV